MAYGSADFRQYNIIQASDFARVYDVEPVTSGFGDFVGPVQQMTHEVRSGETLGTISARYYGTSAKYMDIFNANRALMSLQGPNYLQPGWKLVIPAVPIPQVAKVEAAKVAQAAALQVQAESSQSFLQKNKTLLLVAGLLIGGYLLFGKKSFAKSNPIFRLGKNPAPQNLSPEVISYIETALWSSTDDDGEPLDRNYSIDDLSSSAIMKAKVDVNSFFQKAGELLDDCSSTQAAHDFWLTRNRHGAGFWDGDYEKELGKKLTDISHSFGEVNMYVGDDGKIYIE